MVSADADSSQESELGHLLDRVTPSRNTIGMYNEKDAYKKSVRERLHDDTMMMMMMIEMRSWRKTHVLYCIVLYCVKDDDDDDDM